ncbi:hypothetical protein ERO13_A11G224400v2 [Gossypium hirsutum]|nr:hypothetical protein ERO13_A11G224400v2 [Gossypium hirsutum]
MVFSLLCFFGSPFSFISLLLSFSPGVFATTLSLSLLIPSSHFKFLFNFLVFPRFQIVSHQYLLEFCLKLC